MKYIIPILFALILIGIAAAAPPFTSGTGAVLGCEIRFPAIESIKQDTGFDFNFHLFNLTDGTPVNQSLFKCNFHLYNTTGDHIAGLFVFPDPPSEHGVGNEYALRFNGNNFSAPGQYSYILQCNWTNNGCYISAPIEVTPTGHIFDSPTAIILGVFFLVMVGIFILTLYWALVTPYSNDRNKEGQIIGINELKYLKIACIVLSYVELMFICGIMKGTISNYLYWYDVSGFFNWAYWILLSCLWPAVVISLIVALINFITDRKIQDALQRGITYE